MFMTCSHNFILWLFLLHNTELRYVKYVKYITI
jgi:hypothetical protein